ncbi:MAG: response regulator, partial [Desulfamplus sp.]|nr:response regulator [Desulfamplus sp.]
IYIPLMESSKLPPMVEINKGCQVGEERILLVDDEEVIAELEKKMLERLGYKVTARFHSTEAFEAFKATPNLFDLVITDMAMPSSTGIELSKKILALRGDIPIIICTGFSEKIDAEKVKLIGIKGFLMKPIVRAEMAKIVRQVLDEAKNKSQQET